MAIASAATVGRAQEASKSDVIVFDFDGAKIALDRKWAMASGMSWRKPYEYWKVEPPYRDRILYHIDGLPAPEGTEQCDTVNMVVYASKAIPSPLSNDVWMRIPAEPTGYPDVVRLTQGPTGRPDPPGGFFGDSYRLNAEALRAANGAHPILSCTQVRCRVTLEIQTPIFVNIAYSTSCGISEVSGALISVRRQLREGMAIGATFEGEQK